MTDFYVGMLQGSVVAAEAPTRVQDGVIKRVGLPEEFDQALACNTICKWIYCLLRRGGRRGGHDLLEYCILESEPKESIILSMKFVHLAPLCLLDLDIYLTVSFLNIIKSMYVF